MQTHMSKVEKVMVVTSSPSHQTVDQIIGTHDFGYRPELIFVSLAIYLPL